MNSVSSGDGSSSMSAAPVTVAPAVVASAPVISALQEPATDIKFCAIDDPTCEACQ
jgi:ribonucleoside-diphosphate reductase alpha chain